MSTTLYSLLTKRRLASASGASTDPGQQGLSTAIDAIAALVPAEVLALHTTIVGLSTTAVDGPGPGGPDAVTTILADAPTMSVLFWALLLTSVAFYVIPLRQKPVGVGWYRLAVPPLAFLAWAVMQEGSLFYAAFPAAAGWPAGFRLGFALIAAALVGTVAKRLGVTADQWNPDTGPIESGEGSALSVPTATLRPPPLPLPPTQPSTQPPAAEPSGQPVPDTVPDTVPGTVGAGQGPGDSP